MRWRRCNIRAATPNTRPLTPGEVFRARHLFFGRVAALILAALLIIPSTAQTESNTPTANENTLKSAYIFNFIRYTDWPDSSTWGESRKEGQKVTLAVSGDFPLLKALKRQVLQQQNLQPHIQVRACTIPDCFESSQVLFIGRNSSEQLHTLLQRINSKPVLTISDIPGFADQGGMIELKKEGERMVFRINLQALHPDIYISAQLLQLAEIVGGKP